MPVVNKRIRGFHHFFFMPLKIIFASASSDFILSGEQN